MVAGPLRQDDDAVAHVNGLIDVVSNEEHGRAPVLPKAQDFILHTHAGEGVEGAERLIQQKNFGMINQGASQSYALRHSARKVMRISVGEGFQANEAHKFFHLTAFLLEHAQGSKPRLNITAHRQPREKIGILKDQTSFALGPEIGSSSTSNSPESGKSSPATRRSKVDFPQPLGPTKQTSSAASSDTEIISSTGRRVSG